MAHIRRNGIAIMLAQLQAGIAQGTTSAILLPEQARMLLDAYDKLAQIREHPHFSALMGHIDELVRGAVGGGAREVLELLFTLLINDTWTSTRLAEARLPDYLRVAYDATDSPGGAGDGP